MKSVACSARTSKQLFQSSQWFVTPAARWLCRRRRLFIRFFYFEEGDTVVAYSHINADLSGVLFLKNIFLSLADKKTMLPLVVFAGLQREMRFPASKSTVKSYWHCPKEDVALLPWSPVPKCLLSRNYYVLWFLEVNFVGFSFDLHFVAQHSDCASEIRSQWTFWSIFKDKILR